MIKKYFISIKGNKVHPTTKKQSFEENDPRLKFVAKQFDYRIHFALNCGAKVVPKEIIFNFF